MKRVQAAITMRAQRLRPRSGRLPSWRLQLLQLSSCAGLRFRFVFAAFAVLQLFGCAQAVSDFILRQSTCVQSAFAVAERILQSALGLLGVCLQIASVPSSHLGAFGGTAGAQNC